MIAEREVDARGLACPEPVVQAREALEGADGPFVVLVDNETACANVSRFASSSGCDVEVSSIEGGFAVRITPGGEPLEAGAAPAGAQAHGGTVLLFTSDEVGQADRELGLTLMKAFLFAVTKGEEMPAKAVFMNTGVRLVTENEETAAHVAELADRGVDVIVCGTCLDYYGLTEALKAGRVSNMYEIQASLIGAARVVSL